MLKSENVLIGRHNEQTSVTQMHHKRGSGCEVPSRWAIFCNFLKKKAISMLLDHLLRVLLSI